ncbi:hypothetical protein AG1IA_10444 [Rhizoctonia solani AG-1 IA]|uniref:Uncharacterized protein n=1 Tax=Thanatephorus cucumeris (strain AG1-IA) TaxID=983506 RepID=L8WBH5_THACA|nr:hypothetical protein AG1IA_10444 [Rhizoctonia solani AG-1 IA]
MTLPSVPTPTSKTAIPRRKSGLAKRASGVPKRPGLVALGAALSGTRSRLPVLARPRPPMDFDLDYSPTPAATVADHHSPCRHQPLGTAIHIQPRL